MSRLNPILEDYKLLLVFKNIGVKLLQQLKSVMSVPPYANFFKNVSLTDQNEIVFTYLAHSFKTQIELFFKISKMPDSAFIATYHLPTNNVKDNEEIVSYAFDMKYNVNDIYNIDDFAEYYLIEFHQNLKKSFSDHHNPFPIKINGK